MTPKYMRTDHDFQREKWNKGPLYDPQLLDLGFDVLMQQVRRSHVDISAENPKKQQQQNDST